MPAFVREYLCASCCLFASAMPLLFGCDRSQFNGPRISASPQLQLTHLHVHIVLLLPTISGTRNAAKKSHFHLHFDSVLVCLCFCMKFRMKFLKKKGTQCFNCYAPRTDSNIALIVVAASTFRMELNRVHRLTHRKSAAA